MATVSSFSAAHPPSQAPVFPSQTALVSYTASQSLCNLTLKPMNPGKLAESNWSKILGGKIVEKQLAEILRQKTRRKYRKSSQQTCRKYRKSSQPNIVLIL